MGFCRVARGLRGVGLSPRASGRRRAAAASATPAAATPTSAATVRGVDRELYGHGCHVARNR